MSVNFGALTTYVYDGIEVKRTGRLAVKTVGTAGRTRDYTLHEITPIDEDIGWKKWVPLDQLYEIK